MTPGQVGSPIPPSEWDFEEARFDLDDDLVAVGADLEPGTLVAAYTSGVFPMGLGERGSGPLGWWSPQVRGVLERGELRVTRSLRQSRRRFEVTVDTSFAEVVAACAEPWRDGAWITDEIATAYEVLHERGLAHSVEVWSGEDLVGGLYGLAFGGLFAGESMFHRERDASKVAFWVLAELVFASSEPRLIDAQWPTDHLRTLGVGEMSRADYRAVLPELTRAQPIAWPRPGAVLVNR